MTTTPIGGLPLLPTRPVNPDVIHNQAILLLEVLLRGVLDKDLAVPPAHVDGAAYIVAAGASGAWSGKTGKIALSHGGTWLFWPDVTSVGTDIPIGPAHEGLRVWVADENCRYAWTGSGWSAAVYSPTTGRFDGGIGINFDPSTTNILQAVKDQNAATAIQIANLNGGTAAQAQQRFVAGSGIVYVSIQSGAYTPSGAFAQDGFTIYSDANVSGGITIMAGAAAPLIFGTAAVERGRFDGAGNFQMGATPSTVISAARHVQRRSYTVATLPSAGSAGQDIYVTDESGGPVPAFSDGTNWRRVTDRAVVT